MIALHTAVPHAKLKQFVRLYAQREVHPFASGAATITELIPARLEQILEFEFGVSFQVHHLEGYSEATPGQAVIGAQVKGCSRIELGPEVISFGIFFRPTGFSRLFGVPVREFTNRSCDAALISSQFAQIRNRLADCTTFADRVNTMEVALMTLAARAPKEQIMETVAEHIFLQHGAIRISHLASQAGLGLRQFERNFHQALGVAPKAYARVARFQSALDTKIAAPQRSWVDIAHGLQYHDQMHMIHDFRQLGGDTPRQILAEIGDARPGALQAEGFSYK